MRILFEIPFSELSDTQGLSLVLGLLIGLVLIGASLDDIYRDVRNEKVTKWETLQHILVVPIGIAVIWYGVIDIAVLTIIAVIIKYSLVWGWKYIVVTMYLLVQKFAK